MLYNFNIIKQASKKYLADINPDFDSLKVTINSINKIINNI